MTALAAIPMGIRVRFLIPEPSSGIVDFGDVVIGDWTDPEILRRFAESCDAVTVESEWAPADLLKGAAPETAVWPSPETLDTIRDKGRQKQALRDAGLPVPAFAVCRSPEEARGAADSLGYPLVMKQPVGSYDGYGNATLNDPDDIEGAWKRLGDGGSAILEAWVDFARELTALVARSPSGEIAVYPVAYTEQRDHRCHAVVVPSGADEATERRATEVALRAVEAVGGVGITAVEMFETTDGRILVNELAPRPHNTGHYTIEACHTSQFENHVRAVLDLPLGDPSMRVGAACMVNVLGTTSGAVEPMGWRDALAEAGVAVHLYGKGESRPRRKMGHVTVTGSDPAEVRRRAETAAGRMRL